MKVLALLLIACAIPAPAVDAPGLHAVGTSDQNIVLDSVDFGYVEYADAQDNHSPEMVKYFITENGCEITKAVYDTIQQGTIKLRDLLGLVAACNDGKMTKLELPPSRLGDDNSATPPEPPHEPTATDRKL